MKPAFRLALAGCAAVVLALVTVTATTPMFAAPVAEPNAAAFGIYTLSVQNQTSLPVQIRMEDEQIGVVSPYDYQMFQVPERLARRETVLLTARNAMGDTWSVRVNGHHEQFHWDIHPK